MAKSAMGQSGSQGEPDEEAQAAVREANAVQPGDKLAEDMPELTSDTDTEVAQEIATHILRAMEANPSLAARVVEIATGTQQGRQLLHMPASEGRPTGEYPQNYRRAALRVEGGFEVEHPPGFKPLPPGYITMYVREDGTLTDYATPYYETRTQQVPMRDDNGKQIVNSEGNQIYTEKRVRVVVDPGAKHDAAGQPVLSEQYKRWLELHLNGQRLTSKARSEIQAQNDINGNPAVRMGADGAPMVLGPGVDIAAGE